MASLLRDGWAVLPDDAETRAWADHAAPHAALAASDPVLQRDWLDCEGTWFVGVDALQNDPTGSIEGGPSIPSTVRAACAVFGAWPALHRAQVSVVYPEYPRPKTGENATSFAFRLNRDAAHVDGILGLGTPKRRFVIEPHQWILGIALNDCSADASPLVVWEGSHEVIRDGLGQALSTAQGDISKVDVTDAYIAARRAVFAGCIRREIPLRKGQAVLVHRLALHGVAPWGAAATAPAEGRMIAYFRPVLEESAAWLKTP